MTLKEKIAEVSPSDVAAHYEGGVNGCPVQYAETHYAPRIYCENKDCEACWNQKWLPEYMA